MDNETTRQKEEAVDSKALRCAVDILKAVAHPVRLGVVALLYQQPRNVGEISEKLDVGQSTVSQHLRVLRMSGLVDVEREGAHAVYHITEPYLEELLKCLDKWCATQDTLLTPREEDAYEPLEYPGLI